MRMIQKHVNLVIILVINVKWGFLMMLAHNVQELDIYPIADSVFLKLIVELVGTL